MAVQRPLIKYYFFRLMVNRKDHMNSSLSEKCQLYVNERNKQSLLIFLKNTPNASPKHSNQNCQVFFNLQFLWNSSISDVTFQEWIDTSNRVFHYGKWTNTFRQLLIDQVPYIKSQSHFPKILAFSNKFLAPTPYSCLKWQFNV